MVPTLVTVASCCRVIARCNFTVYAGRRNGWSFFLCRSSEAFFGSTAALSGVLLLCCVVTLLCERAIGRQRIAFFKSISQMVDWRFGAAAVGRINSVQLLSTGPLEFAT